MLLLVVLRQAGVAVVARLRPGRHRRRRRRGADDRQLDLRHWISITDRIRSFFFYIGLALFAHLVGGHNPPVGEPLIGAGGRGPESWGTHGTHQKR